MNKEDKFDVCVNIGCHATLPFTSLKFGYDASIDYDDFAGVSTDKDGKTIVHYYTGNPDCEIDCFAVKESVEEANKLVDECSAEVQCCINNYTVVDKNYLAMLEKIVGKEEVEKIHKNHLQ